MAEAHLPECTQAPEPRDLLLNHPSEHPLSSLPAQAPKGASPAPGGSANPHLAGFPAAPCRAARAPLGSGWDSWVWLCPTPKGKANPSLWQEHSHKATGIKE